MYFQPHLPASSSLPPPGGDPHRIPTRIFALVSGRSLRMTSNLPANVAAISFACRVCSLRIIQVILWDIVGMNHTSLPSRLCPFILRLQFSGSGVIGLIFNVSYTSYVCYVFYICCAVTDLILYNQYIYIIYIILIILYILNIIYTILICYL